MSDTDIGISKNNQSRLRRARRLLQMVAATAVNPVERKDKYGNWVRWTEPHGMQVERKANRMIRTIDYLLHADEEDIDD